MQRYGECYMKGEEPQGRQGQPPGVYYHNLVSRLNPQPSGRPASRDASS
ncbi:hypothetical protein FOCG_17734 [Fusarium oxysporum f. sp. radicis-lycopersici 26381]|uniref:Uncharacterized protein n=1 Tax=Fusarium oxysporum f. sp. melonis 26406 TaxID=1089452 RepID=W9ZX55_FUSOX|nr:hypothetical protein FOMG_17688 [Fusarium oxysporum f. sp. melonis 26406]EXL39679.1 hypothetical protein FOCG_17734 [Fusarium oxysporum f. sp. radicis-lycopersici 26381]